MTNLERIQNMEFDEMFDFIMSIEFSELRQLIYIEGQWMTQAELQYWLESEV